MSDRASDEEESREGDEARAGEPAVAPPLARGLFDEPRMADPMADPLTDGKRPELAPPAPIPVRERDDELMAHPPAADYHRGRLAGYSAGAGARKILLALTVVLVVAGALVVAWWARNRPPAHPEQYQLPAGSDLEGRPRVMVWTGGKARLGLDRQPPGVLAIELPDRTLRLADGSDQAQLQLEVREGKTVALKVLFGEVVEELGAGAEPLVVAK